MTVGAVYMGDGTKCLGDNNQNGADDACDRPCSRVTRTRCTSRSFRTWKVGTYGIDVMADDWQCTETGPCRYSLLGSWMHGVEGTILNFEFRIYDIFPRAESDRVQRPGQMLWAYVTDNFNPVKREGPPEGCTSR